LGREIHCDNHTFRINPKCRRAEVYNNILCNGFTAGDGWFVSHNVLVNRKPHQPITRFDRAVDDAGLEDSEAFDGKLAPDSPAIDAGTRALPPSTIYPQDFYGTERDQRPDCGAFEVPGRTPEPEPALPVFEGPARVFVDDFRDGNLREDPWLSGKGQRGLAWQPPKGQQAWSVQTPDNDAALLSPIGLKGPTWMLTAGDETWRDCTVTVKIDNAYNDQGGGVLLRGNLATEGYLVDLARGTILLRQIDEVGDIESVELASGNELLPRQGAQTYVISISDTDHGTAIRVDADQDGDPELTATDPAKQIPVGRIAIYNDSPNGWHRINLVSIKVE
jgi:hypothetical protein